MEKEIVFNPLHSEQLQYVSKITSGTVATAAATAAKEVTIAGYTPAVGDVLCITYTLGTSAASPKLSINGGDAISIYLGSTAASALTHTVGSNGEIMYYYDGTNLQMFGSMRTSDSDTMQYVYWASTSVAGTAFGDYKILMQTSDGKWHPLTLEEGTGTTKTISPQTFVLNSPILYYATTTNVAKDAQFSLAYQQIQMANTLRYTDNQATRTAYQSIYLKGTVSAGLFTLTNSDYTSFLTQTLPSTDDGFVYIRLGYMYATNNMLLTYDHPIYQYKDGNLRQYVPTSNEYLKLDQTTPQTISNGIPSYAEGHGEFTDQHMLVDKEYVDSAVARVGASFFMLDAADGDVAAYKSTAMVSSTLATASVSASVNAATDTLIEEWISPTGMDWTSLESGVYDLNIFAEKTGGNRAVRLFWRFYERKTDDSEVLIATSNLSELVTSKARLRIYATLTSDYTPSADSRLVGKVYMNTVGGSQNTTTVLYYQGTEDSHWEIPVSQEFIDTNYALPIVDTYADLADLDANITKAVVREDSLVSRSYTTMDGDTLYEKLYVNPLPPLYSANYADAYYIYTGQLLTLDTAATPADFAVGATITGSSSGSQAVIGAKLTSLTYTILHPTGSFTDGETLSDGTNSADQGTGYPSVGNDTVNGGLEASEDEGFRLWTLQLTGISLGGTLYLAVQQNYIGDAFEISFDGKTYLRAAQGWMDNLAYVDDDEVTAVTMYDKKPDTVTAFGAGYIVPASDDAANWHRIKYALQPTAFEINYSGIYEKIDSTWTLVIRNYKLVNGNIGVPVP